ncbi:hypothetical protein ACFQZF_06945 [Flavobacterium myungsuense]|uniref:Outer membrane protein beta-barrel domain-containing protein n=1 Tax=Flavobacterium myungsuense TaxID=651823 RepID=A0ABW3J288_9FLAO
MKKIILTAAAVFAFSFANAQDLKSKKGENYLPEAGDWAISFNATGVFNYVGNAFNGSLANTAPTVANATPNSFVGKKFIDAKSAYRVVANLGFGSNNNPGGVVSGYAFGAYKASTFNLTAGVGKEWRRGSTRLQGFYGADALVGFTSTKWTEDGAPKQIFNAGTSINLGVNGFIGAEYFLFPKIAIGAQYNYGLRIASNGASKYSATGVPEVEVSKSSSNINLGNVTSASMNLTLHF